MALTTRKLLEIRASLTSVTLENVTEVGFYCEVVVRQAAADLMFAAASGGREQSSS